MQYKLVDNREAKRYEFQVGEHLARVEYIKAQDRIYLTHTEVPGELAGKGVGSELVKASLEDIKDQGLTLVPLCPFVALFLKRNPQWKELVLKGINIA